MLCYGCMTEKGEVDVCPHCGYVHQSDEGEHYYLEAGTVLNNRYIIGKVLGHGGFGITYLGLDQNLDLRVAIKEYLPSDIATRSEGQSTVLSFSGDKGDQYQYGLERFLDEAKSLAKYNHHPCIVSTTDFFKSNNTAYLVMEYLDGIPLNEYLNRKGGKLPVKDAIEIMMPMMDALREVHGAGMIHRDISPDNIHITKTGQVKLLDFGAARFALGEKSKSLSVILKPGYAPPEQYASRGKQGPWTDVYAVAATLYRCVTNQKLPDAMDRMLNDDVKKPSEMGLAISSKQEAALMKALSIRHEDRCQTIKALQDQLVQVEEAEKKPVNKQVHDEPVVNRPTQNQVSRDSKSNRGEADQIDIRGLKKSSDDIVKSLQSASSDQNATGQPKQNGINIKRIVGIAAGILVCILIGVAVNNSYQQGKIDKAWNELTKFPAYSVPLTDAEVEYIRGVVGKDVLPNEITHLELINAKLDIEKLSVLQNLNVLALISTDSLKFVDSDLSGFDNLDILELNNMNLTSFDWIKSASHLSGLSINNNQSIISLDFLKDWNLNYLEVSNCQVDDYLPIIGMEALNYLELDGDGDFNDWDILSEELIRKGYPLDSSMTMDSTNYQDIVVDLDLETLTVLKEPFDPEKFNLVLDWTYTLDRPFSVSPIFTQVLNKTVLIGDNFLYVFNDEGNLEIERELPFVINDFTTISIDSERNLVAALSRDYTRDDSYVYKFSLDGNLLNTYKVDGILQCSILNSDDSFTAVYLKNDLLYITRISNDGLVIYDELLKYRSSTLTGEGMSLIETHENTNICVTTKSYGEVEEDDIYVFEISDSGTIIQSNSIYSDKSPYITKVTQLKSGEYMLLGTIAPESYDWELEHGLIDLYYITLDDRLNLVNDLTTGDDYFNYQDVSTFDDEFIFTICPSLSFNPEVGRHGLDLRVFDGLGNQVLNEDLTTICDDESYVRILSSTEMMILTREFDRFIIEKYSMN